MKALIITLTLFPFFALAQTKQDNYDIYSKYLKIYQNEKKTEFNFVIRESTDYVTKYKSKDIEEIGDELRGYLIGDKVSMSSVQFLYRQFIPTLKADTLWMPLIFQLDQEMKKEYVLKNMFSNDLRATVITNKEYDKYFRNSRNLTKEWKTFHRKFPNRAVIAQFSQIAYDNKRAVFYFSSQCGGLCGVGQLVLFYKDNAEWKYLCTLLIWQS
jgi:hypothetical protein